ncbi:hypothetical protein ACI7RC_05980 [Brevibacillus sp. B_LB10_24]|uniref:hypothetical protein n=1 Tax=Brevibacillus sp. B_LB10_24 TaxID=3380645 RepID=UPI0038BCB74D
MASKTMEKIYIGQMARLQRTFTEEDVKRCIALTGDDNAVYRSDAFQWGPYRPVIPGLLSEGLMTEVITKKLPGTPALLLQKELVYCHPVYVGDTITAELEIIDIDLKRSWITSMVRCLNQFGREVVKGQVVVLVVADMDEQVV